MHVFFFSPAHGSVVGVGVVISVGAVVGVDVAAVGFEDDVDDGNPDELLVGAVVTGADVGMNDGTAVGFGVGILTGESVVVGTEIGELVEHSSKKNLV